MQISKPRSLQNSVSDRLQNSEQVWNQNAAGFAAPCPAGAGSSFKDRIHFLTQGSAEFWIRLKMMFLTSGKPQNMSGDDFERNEKVRFCGLF